MEFSVFSCAPFLTRLLINFEISWFRRARATPLESKFIYQNSLRDLRVFHRLHSARKASEQQLRKSSELLLRKVSKRTPEFESEKIHRENLNNIEKWKIWYFHKNYHHDASMSHTIKILLTNGKIVKSENFPRLDTGNINLIIISSQFSLLTRMMWIVSTFLSPPTPQLCVMKFHVLKLKYATTSFLSVVGECWNWAQSHVMSWMKEKWERRRVKFWVNFYISGMLS